MPKRKNRGRGRAAPPSPRLAPRKAKFLAAALLVALAAAGTAGSRLSFLRAPLFLAPAPAPASPSPPALAKEYVYAGGRMVAIEEPAPPPAGPPPTNLVATASSSAQASLSWSPPADPVSHYVVERSQTLNGFVPVASNVSGTSYNDSLPGGVAAYLYRVRAVYSSGAQSSYSNTDLATAVVFTDRPLQSGVTVIKAQHLIELRQAVGAVRTLSGLGPASWTYPDPVSEPAGQRRPIYLEDVLELRAQLDAALTALGRYQAYPAEPSLARGAKVYKEHFQQIRDRVE